MSDLITSKFATVYLLRYTVRNLSLRNTAFHWLMSGFTSLTTFDFGKQYNLLKEKSIDTVH